MTFREQICQEALSWQGTPYHDHCAVRGLATDCVGVVIGIAKAVQALPADWQPGYYSPSWHLHQNSDVLLAILEVQHFPAIPLETRQPGDVLVMQFGRVSRHTAILVAQGPEYIIHAARSLGGVALHRLDTSLLARVRRCYAFPGVTT